MGPITLVFFNDVSQPGRRSPHPGVPYNRATLLRPRRYQHGLPGTVIAAPLYRYTRLHQALPSQGCFERLHAYLGAEPTLGNIMRGEQWK